MRANSQLERCLLNIVAPLVVGFGGMPHAACCKKSNTPPPQKSRKLANFDPTSKR